MPAYDYYRVAQQIPKADYQIAVSWYEHLRARGRRCFISSHKGPHGLVYCVWVFGQGAARNDNTELCDGKVVKATDQGIKNLIQGQKAA